MCIEQHPFTASNTALVRNGKHGILRAAENIFRDV